MIAALFFYLFSAMAVASAVMVISARNPVHSVLFLILTYIFGVSKELAAWGMIALFFTIRILSMRYGWRTRPVLKDPPK